MPGARPGRSAGSSRVGEPARARRTDGPARDGQRASTAPDSIASTAPGAQTSGPSRPGPARFGDGRHRPLEGVQVGRVDDARKCSLIPRRWVREAARRRVEPALGEDRLGAARVGEAGAALDEAVADEAVDQARDAALAEQDLVGELAHPDPPVGRLGDRQQRVVLGEREVVLGAQLLVQAPGDPGMREQERSPRGEARVAGGQRSSRGLGDGHGWMLPPRYGTDDVVDSATISQISLRSQRQTGAGQGPRQDEGTHPMATFAIDPAHTDVLFSAKHMMVTTVRGTFTDVSGTIELDEARPDRFPGGVRHLGGQHRYRLRCP